MFEMLESVPGTGVLIAPGVHRLRLVPPPRPPAVRLAELLELEPSAETLGELVEWQAADLDAGERVQVLQLWERHCAWTAACTQQAIVDVAGPEPAAPSPGTRQDDDWAALDVAVALRLSPGGAARRIITARELTGRLRATLTALETGAISFWYALSLVEAVEQLDDTAAHAVQATVLDGAGQLTVRQFRDRLRRAVIAAAPKTADERHQQATKERRVVLSPDTDAMAWLSVYLTAPQAVAAYRRIDDYAHAQQRPAGNDPATGPDEPDPELPAGLTPVDARRADAFLALLFGADPAAAPTSRGNTGGTGTTAPPAPPAPSAARATPRGCGSGSPSTGPPCSASPSTPANSPATAPSHPNSPAPSPPTASGSA